MESLRVGYLLLMIAATVVRGYCAKKYGKRGEEGGVSTRLEKVFLALPFFGMFLVPLLYALTPWLSFADYALPLWTGIVGAGLFIVSIWLLWRSHVDLGSNWSPVLRVKDDHMLVTHGVYRYVRHPMYASHWLWGIAQLLLLTNWVAGPAMLISMAPLYFLRVPREEKMMVEEFGGEYREYMKRTGRLVPFL